MKKYMKFVTMVAVIVAVVSCTKILNRTPKINNFAKIDFTEYTEKGFLFSPYQYNGEYEAIGIINYKFIPSAIYKDNKTTSRMKVGNKTEEYTYFSKSWISDDYNVYDLLDSLYNWSSSKGANAIIDLKLNTSSEYFGYGYINPVTVNGIEITGFAIKRK